MPIPSAPSPHRPQGIAPSKVLAKLASGLHKPRQQTLVPPVSIEGLLADLALGRLRSLGGKFGDSLAQVRKKRGGRCWCTAIWLAPTAPPHPANPAPLILSTPSSSSITMTAAGCRGPQRLLRPDHRGRPRGRPPGAAGVLGRRGGRPVVGGGSAPLGCLMACGTFVQFPLHSPHPLTVSKTNQQPTGCTA
jgi:hypothetical protein